MSLRVLAFGLAFVLGGTACKKQEATSSPAQAPAAKPPTGAPETAPAAAPATAESARKVPIDVVQEGYAPDRIPGKPGEKLTLVFTRKVDGHCYEELRTPDGKLIALPKNKPVEVPVTVPQDGEVKFACGMDMLSGVVVAEKR